MSSKSTHGTAQSYKTSLTTIIGTGTLWFASSAIFSTWSNTAFLIFFNDPLLHTAIRFMGSAVLGGGVLIFNNELELRDLHKLFQVVVKPAMFLWIANFANSLALNLTGITLTYVVKASIPVFTVAICSISGQRFHLLIYVSLLPICIGVALASGTYPNPNLNPHPSPTLTLRPLALSLTPITTLYCTRSVKTYLLITITPVRK